MTEPQQQGERTRVTIFTLRHKNESITIQVTGNIQEFTRILKSEVNPALVSITSAPEIK